MQLRESKDKQVRMGIAFLLILLLVAIVGPIMWRYIDAFFVAVFSYVFLNPLYKLLRRKGLGKTFSASFAIIVGIIVVGIPLLIFSALLVQEVLGLITPVNVSQGIGLLSTSMDFLDQTISGLNVRALVQNELSGLAATAIDAAKNLILNSIQNIGGLTIDLLIALFTLYYLLVAEDSLSRLGESVIPFNKKNTGLLIYEFKNVIYSVLVCTGLVGLIQAVPLALVFAHFGIPAALFWGVIAFILACIPFVGVPVLWVPMALFELLSRNYAAAIGITLVGLVVFAVENLRPILQKKVGQIHPLISVLGVIIGLEYFGVLGVLIGPIILSYTVLTIKMFKEEYL